MMESGHLNELTGHHAVRSDSDVHLHSLCNSNRSTQEMRCPPSLTPSTALVKNTPALFPDASQGRLYFPGKVTDRMAHNSSTLLPKVKEMCDSSSPSQNSLCEGSNSTNDRRAHGGGNPHNDPNLHGGSFLQVGSIVPEDVIPHDDCGLRSGSVPHSDSGSHRFVSHSDSCIGCGSATSHTRSGTHCGRMSHSCNGTHIVGGVPHGGSAPCSATWSHGGSILQSSNVTHGGNVGHVGGHLLCGNILYSDYDSGIPSSSTRNFPCNDGFHDCQSDRLPLLKAQSDTGAASLRKHHQQSVPKSLSWVLCGKVMKEFLGAKIHVGEESSPPLLTPGKDPATDSLSSSASDGPICRICHEGDGEGKLVQPCRCCGTLRYTHRRCLETWLQTKNDDVCELCLYHFHTQRRDRPFKQWLQRPARPQDRRNVLLDVLCFCLLTPMVFTSAWLCIHGAFYYLSYFDNRGLQGLGLIVLATILIVIFLFWTFVSLRYHCIIWDVWRRENQTVHIIVPDRTPSVIHRGESRNNSCSVVASERKTDINGNFLWLHSVPHDAAFV